MADRAGGGGEVRRLPPRLAVVPRRGFVGRAAELDALEGLIRGAGARRALAIGMVAGEPGAGKTTLAAAVARRAADRGCQVAYGRAEEGLEIPFGPWRQALGGRWPPRHTEREDLFDEVVDQLSSAALQTPMLIVLDDLQWADQASLLLIAHTTAAQPSAALGMLLSYRSTEAAPASPLGGLLATLAREPGIVRLQLAGLAQEDVEALMGVGRDEALDERERRVARNVWADTCGNPFFVTALLDELAQGGPPSTLKEVVGHRVARLGPTAATVLRAAAVVGEVFEPSVVGAVTGVDEPAVLDVLEAAAAAGLVTEASSLGFSFVHALVGDTLAAELSAPRRRELHRAAAAALQTRSGNPAVVARHLVAADPEDCWGRDAAVDAAVEAGRAAVDSLAYESAVSRFTEAVDMVERWGLDETRRCTSLLGLARALHLAGQPEQAAAAAAAGIDLAVRLARWDDVRLALLRFPMTASAVPDTAVVEALERAARAAPEGSSIRALAMAALVVTVHYAWDHQHVRSLAEEAVALADCSGDTAARVHTRNWLLLEGGGHPDLPAQLELLRSVEELSRTVDDVLVRPLDIQVRRVYVLMRMGDLEAVDKEIQRIQAVDRRRGRDQARWWLPNVQAMRAILAGRLAEGEGWSAKAAATAGRHGAHATAGARLAHVASIAYLQGRLGEMADQLADFAQEFSIPALRAVLVNALAHAGRETEARELLSELTGDDLARVQRDDAWTTAAFMLADACRMLDAPAQARTVYRALEPHAGEFVVTSGASAACFGAIDRSLGQLALVCGWDDRASDHLDHAVRLNARAGARPFLALARVDQAALGVPGAADEARRIATELGIDLVLRRLEVLEGATSSRAAVLRSGAGFWTVTYAGRTAQVRDLLGLRYLCALLARPGQEVAAVELQGGTGDGGTPVLDEQAKAAYRRRLEEIDDELEEADKFADAERAARAAEQREALARELARAVGLGGRGRVMGSDAERARLNVTRAVRAAIDRIGEVHPELGHHLRLAVRTGTYCAYEPDPGLSLAWSLP